MASRSIRPELCGLLVTRSAGLYCLDKLDTIQSTVGDGCGGHFSIGDNVGLLSNGSVWLCLVDSELCVIDIVLFYL